MPVNPWRKAGNRRQRTAGAVEYSPESRLGMLLVLVGTIPLIAIWVAEWAVLTIQTRSVTAVFSTLLAHSNNKVQELSDLLASDYGLRETILTRDPATIDSALHNHQKRVGAQRMLALTSDSLVTADTQKQIPAGSRFSQTELAIIALQKITTLHVTAGKLYRYSRSVVEAPGPAGELIVGYDMEQRLVKHVQYLMHMNIAFGCVTGPTNMRINRGSFGEAAVPALQKVLGDSSEDLSGTVAAGSGRIIARLPLDIDTGERCFAVLGESTQPFDNGLLIVKNFGRLTLGLGLAIFFISLWLERRNKKQLSRSS